MKLYRTDNGNSLVIGPLSIRWSRPLGFFDIQSKGSSRRLMARTRSQGYISTTGERRLKRVALDIYYTKGSA